MWYLKHTLLHKLIPRERAWYSNPLITQEASQVLLLDHLILLTIKISALKGLFANTSFVVSLNVLFSGHRVIGCCKRNIPHARKSFLSISFMPFPRGRILPAECSYGRKVKLKVLCHSPWGNPLQEIGSYWVMTSRVQCSLRLMHVFVTNI